MEILETASVQAKIVSPKCSRDVFLIGAYQDCHGLPVVSFLESMKQGYAVVDIPPPFRPSQLLAVYVHKHLGLDDHHLVRVPGDAYYEGGNYLTFKALHYEIYHSDIGHSIGTVTIGGHQYQFVTNGSEAFIGQRIGQTNKGEHWRRLPNPDGFNDADVKKLFQLAESVGANLVTMTLNSQPH